MTVLMLAAALQLPMAPTTTDSAVAVAALDSAALAAPLAGREAGSSHLATRLLAQYRTWRSPAEMWAAVRRHDEAAGPERQLTPLIIADLFQSGDHALALRRLRALPRAERDGVVLRTASMIRQIEAPTFAELARLTSSPPARAALMSTLARTRFAVGETAMALAALGEAMRLTRSQGEPSPNMHEWALQIRAWGGLMPVDSLVVLALERRPRRPGAAGPDAGDLLRARVDVARMLALAEPRTAAALADTLLLQFEPDSTVPSLWQRAELHQLRGRDGDSATGRILRDSASARLQSGPDAAERAANVVGQAFFEAASGRDTAAFRRALGNPALDPARLRATIETTTAVALRTWTPRMAAPDGPPPLEWLAFVLRVGWPVTGRLEVAVRDSVRVALVRLLAALDPIAALDSAGAVATQPYRDRAIAEAVRSIAAVDADRAAREAEALTDGEAQGVAYLELVERAAAGGRLAAAAAFAGRVPGGERRVRAEYAVASALAAGGDRDAARAHIRVALRYLDPLWRCEGYCSSSELSGMSRRVVGDLAVRAVALGMRDDLWRWAAAQPPNRRAAAWLLLPEAIAHVTAKRSMVYPMH